MAASVRKQSEVLFFRQQDSRLRLRQRQDDFVVSVLRWRVLATNPHRGLRGGCREFPEIVCYGQEDVLPRGIDVGSQFRNRPRWFRELTSFSPRFTAGANRGIREPWVSPRVRTLPTLTLTALT